MSNTQSPDPIVFVLTPVSDPPKESGWYNCYKGDEFLGQDYLSEGKFQHKPVTHWLRKSTLSELLKDKQKRIEELEAEVKRLNGLVAKAFNAFRMRPYPHNEPTWEQFKKLNNIQ